MLDVYAMNFPSGRQSLNNGGSSKETEAIFEVKIFTVFKAGYTNKNTRTAPADRRARMVVRNTDVKVAADIVGDGKSCFTGLFEAAK